MAASKRRAATLAMEVFNSFEELDAAFVANGGHARRWIVWKRSKPSGGSSMAIRSLDPNFFDLLKCFHNHGVRYLLIGGYAVIHHGYDRLTKDLDLWIAADPDNAQRVSAAPAWAGRRR